MSEKNYQLKQRRIFSDALKKHIVKNIESGKIRIRDVMDEYDVSRISVYRWLKKYCRHLQQSKTLVIQMDSESSKSKLLEKKVQELEAALGRKQMEIDFLNRMLEQGKEELGVDLKKKYCTPPSTGSERTA